MASKTSSPNKGYTLIRSRRKTVVLMLDDEGNVVVKAPLKTGLSFIEGFLKQKAGWIEAKRAELEKRAALRPVLSEEQAADTKKRARAVIGERLAACEAQTGLHTKGFRVTSARTRWGSCSKKGTLNFTWRLTLCPTEIIDAVIIHELCHLVCFNHSKEFWGLVERYCPDYKKKRQWLFDHQGLMDV